MKNLLILGMCCTIFLLPRAYGQKKYDINISFVKNEVDFKNVGVNYIDGNKIIPMTLNSLGLAHSQQTANFKHPVLEFTYKARSNQNIHLRFFLTKPTVALQLGYDPISDSVFLVWGKGIISFDAAGEKEFENFAHRELASLESLGKKNNYSFEASDTADLNQLTIYVDQVRERKIEFIGANPKLKYSLWLFIDDILGNAKYSNEFQVQLYNHLRPHYINTFEDDFILEKLDKHRLAIRSVAPYLNQPFNDQHGNAHRLKDYAGKYVLIIIWATWCIPCVEELPKLKELYSKHAGHVEFISFSTDRDKLIHDRFIQSKNVSWLSIFGSYDLTQTYGANVSIPQAYLLDKDGRIMYSQTFYKDFGLLKLAMLMDKLALDSQNESKSKE